MSGKEANKIFDDGELKLQLNEKIFKFHNERQLKKKKTFKNNIKLNENYKA